MNIHVQQPNKRPADEANVENQTKKKKPKKKKHLLFHHCKICKKCVCNSCMTKWVTTNDNKEVVETTEEKDAHASIAEEKAKEATKKNTGTRKKTRRRGARSVKANMSDKVDFVKEGNEDDHHKDRESFMVCDDFKYCNEGWRAPRIKRGEDVYEQSCLICGNDVVYQNSECTPIV